ncbi:hypothetical protein Sulac_1953 [Sulfobacillus acidophilus DSM 10332]|uniref:Uncharacterized protein n=1 Tax=Sulfobacillus acidophilus (strain ATCC 700253 / DSM 10332 / NAL) TaxID=679936 RepID=G8U1C4_SULAD|nr:hypothetical protein Sulac_1953 [Sulfobacillus acidophilus DSM 10332]
MRTLFFWFMSAMISAGNDIGVTYDNQYCPVLIKPGEEVVETKIRFPETAPPYTYWFRKFSLVMVDGLLSGLKKGLWAVPHMKESW